MLPKITDYWDERVHAIDTAAAELLELGDPERDRAVSEISEAVLEHVRVLPDETLLRAAVPILDDLYKAACAIGRWDAELGSYLDATAGTFLALMKDRGYRCQYLVDNAWEDMTRPLRLFPSWYAAAGIVYACPQNIAFELMQTDDPATTQDDLAQMLPVNIREARDVTARLVDTCRDEGRHLVLLDADFEERSFAVAFEQAGTNGVLTVFRNQAPVSGSTVQTWFPDAAASP
jgi:hypothetical protein